MGLDMYLTKKLYLGCMQYDKKFSAEINIEYENKKIPIDVTQINGITLEAGYWRKANQIHKWFVDNVQDGVDDCGEYYVAYDKLKELLSACKEVIAVKGIRDKEKQEKVCREVLPTQTGFFFGSYEYDEWYFDQVQNTIDILQKIDFEELKESKIPISFYYSSSW